MSVYRLVNKEPVLFAEKNIINEIRSGHVLLKINTSDDLYEKVLTLNGNNLAWKSGVNLDFTDKITKNSILEKFGLEDSRLDGYDISIHELFNSVNAGNQNNVSSCNLIDLKTKINGDAQKYLVWDDDGISSNLNLVFDNTNGSLRLEGYDSDNKTIDEVDLKLFSHFKHIGIYRKTETGWSPNLPDLYMDDGVTLYPEPDQSEYPADLAVGDYVILFAFDQRNDGIDYTFAYVEEIIDKYYAGNGLTLVQLDDEKTQQYNVVVDTSRGVTLSEDQTKVEMKLTKVTDETFNTLAENNIVLHKKATEDKAQIRFLAPLAEDDALTGINPNFNGIFCVMTVEPLHMKEYNYQRFRGEDFNNASISNSFIEPVPQNYADLDNKAVQVQAGQGILTRFFTNKNDPSLKDVFVRSYINIEKIDDNDGSIISNMEELRDDPAVFGRVTNWSFLDPTSQDLIRFNYDENKYGAVMGNGKNPGTLYAGSHPDAGAVSGITVRFMSNNPGTFNIKVEWWNVMESGGDWNSIGANCILESDIIKIIVE